MRIWVVGILVVLALVVLATLPTCEAGIWDGLVGYWTLQEGGGNILYDYSGSDLDGVLHGTRWVDRGNFNSLYFDGRAYVGVPLGPLPNGTLSLWIYCNNSSGGLIAMLSDEHTTLRLERDGESGKLLYRISTPEGEHRAYAERPLTLDQWIHVLVTFGSDEAKMYVSGVRQGRSLTAVSGLHGSPQLFIGGAPSEQGFWGEIAHVRLYDRQLVSGEVWLLTRAVEPILPPPVERDTSKVPSSATPKHTPTPREHAPTPSPTSTPTATSPTATSTLPLEGLRPDVELPITPGFEFVFAMLALLALVLRRSAP